MRAASILLPVALAGCVARGPAEQSHPLAQGALRCIELSQVVGRGVLSGQLVFQISNGSRYRNDLQGACAPLNRATGGEIVQTITNGGDLCRGDPVRIYDPAVIEAGQASGVLQCRAGDFTPVTGG